MLGALFYITCCRENSGGLKLTFGALFFFLDAHIYMPLLEMIQVKENVKTHLDHQVEVHSLALVCLSTTPMLHCQRASLTGDPQ
jgi:hypothetical protein